jgi:hypothetical protein
MPTTQQLPSRLARRPSLLLALALTVSSGGCLELSSFPDEEEDQEEIDFPVDTETPASDDDDDDDTAPEEPLEEDDAVLLSFEFPTSMDCGEVAVASILVGNTGSAGWTQEAGYKLGTVDDTDPFYGPSTRVWLDDEAEVTLGHSHQFTFELVAPEEPGLYQSDWRMVREGFHWFGESGSAEIDVICEDDPPDPEPSPPDLATVTWLHTDVSQWAQTAALSSVSLSSGSICLDYDKANVWPIYDIGVDVVANPWIFIWENNQWYGATWEWMRPGQLCKSASSVAGSHIKQAPFGEFSGWVPTSGTTYWFMVTGLARFSERNAEERSNLVPFVWP